MGRLILFLVLIAILYVAWDRGAFGNHPDGVGPGQKLGEVVDRGMAKAGRAVERAGEKVEAAAEGHSSPYPSPTPVH